MEYITNNVIVGNAEVPAVRTKQGIAWVLPGGKRTKDKAIAYAYAKRMDAIITANLTQYSRKILRK